MTLEERVDELERNNRELRQTLLEWESIIARYLAWGNHAYDNDNPSGFRPLHTPMREIRRRLRGSDAGQDVQSAG